MKTRLLTILVTGMFVCSMIGMAHASLMSIGTADYDSNGDGTADVFNLNLIYDDVDLITWLDYTRSTSNWQGQVNWAATLNGANVLTYHLNANVSAPSWDDNDPWHLPLVPEMQALYGGNTGVFSKLVSDRYWTGSYPYSGWADTFHMGTGEVWLRLDWYKHLGLAARSGEVETTLVPDPASGFLLGTGLIGLLGLRRRKMV